MNFAFLGSELGGVWNKAEKHRITNEEETNYFFFPQDVLQFHSHRPRTQSASRRSKNKIKTTLTKGKDKIHQWQNKNSITGTIFFDCNDTY